MKTLQAYLIIALSTVLVSGCNRGENPTSSVSTVSAGSLSKSAGPSATGQGRIVGTDRVFAFNAKTNPDGSVRGEGQLTYTHNGNDVRIHFTIDCITLSGNVATMSGTVTNSNVFSSGGPCWFRVKDNGEGVQAPPDEMTGFLFCEPNDPDPICSQLTCGTNIGLGLRPIEAGNIQVKQ